MPKASRGVGALGAATALALAAGCGFGGGEEPASDEERLVEMLNESYRLDAELSAAENRIIRACLEGQGHTVHDEWELQVWEPEEQESLSWGYPHENFILDPDEAAEYGFGAWADSSEAQESGEAEEYWNQQEEEWAEEEENWEEPDNSAFEALSKEDKYAWYVAYVGEEKAESWYSYVLEEDDFEEGDYEDLTEEEMAALEEEMATAEPEGELDFEDEAHEEPRPGGCQLEMIEGLYGQPELVEHTEEYDGQTETWTEWSYRPQNPEYTDDNNLWEDIELAYADRMIDKQYEFTDCLAERGHAGWEFSEAGYLPTWEYFAQMYWEEEEWWSESDAEVPPLPADLPDTYEGKKAYEIQVAVDFTECAEETGYTAASEQAWDEVNIDAYSAIEEDVYAWQQEMKEAISKAQDMIDA